jgi:hypothetical protein
VGGVGGRVREVRVNECLWESNTSLREGGPFIYTWVIDLLPITSSLQAGPMAGSSLCWISSHHCSLPSRTRGLRQ